MIDLSSFVRVGFLKEELEKNCVVITNIDEANAFILDISRGILRNVIFEKSSLKSYTFGKIQDLCTVNIINCNCTLERFCESLSSELTIYDNINLCKNPDILDIVVNKKGILVC